MTFAEDQHFYYQTTHLNELLDSLGATSRTKESLVEIEMPCKFTNPLDVCRDGYNNFLRHRQSYLLTLYFQVKEFEFEFEVAKALATLEQENKFKKLLKRIWKPLVILDKLDLVLDLKMKTSWVEIAKISPPSWVKKWLLNVMQDFHQSIFIKKSMLPCHWNVQYVHPKTKRL